MSVTYRPADTAAYSDRAFLVGSWCDSFKSSHYAGILFTEDYAPVMHAQIERVLARPEVTAIIACDPDDPNFFLGHIVAEVDPGETPIVHYLFVKAPYRKKGYARGLLDAAGVNVWSYFVYTCRTEVVREIIDKAPRARFDPNGIRYSKSNRRRSL